MASRQNDQAPPSVEPNMKGDSSNDENKNAHFFVTSSKLWLRVPFYSKIKQNVNSIKINQGSSFI